MKLPIALILCAVFGAVGFIGGRFSGKPVGSGSPDTPAKAEVRDAQGPGRGGDDDSIRSRNPAGSKTERRTSSSNQGGSTRLADSLREILATWNKPGIVLENGDERDVLHADLGRLSEIMASIGRADAADLAEIRDVLLKEEESGENGNDISMEGEMLKALLILPLTGRDIELRGSAVLDEAVEKSAEVEDDMFSEMLPMMLYSLARQNPAEAETWLKSFQARPDVDDFTVDVDELKAVIEKGKVDP